MPWVYFTLALTSCMVRCRGTAVDPCPVPTHHLSYEVQRLVRKVEALEEEKVRLTIGLEQLTNQMKAVTQKLDGQLTDKLDALTQKVDGPLTDRLDTLTQQVGVQTTERSDLLNLVGNLNTSDERQREAIEGLTKDVKRLTDTVERTVRKIDQLNGTICARCEPELKPRSCAEASALDRFNGVYTLDVNDRDITVYCDQTTEGGGWAVIQRREDGHIDFYHGWDAYVHGFGDPTSEMWLGLENIHHITKTRNYKLRVDLMAFDGETAFAEYDQFYIDGPDQEYRLHVNGFSGTAGNSLALHNDYRFSTFDEDNDRSANNCASSFHGAWWYKSCHEANLNGPYRQSAANDPDGITWFKWKDAHIALKRVEMKVKPTSR